MTQNVQRESAIPIAIAGVRPRYLKAGNRVELSIVGSGFVKGTQVAFRPANGIEVQTIHTISSAELRVVVFLDGGVAPGQRDVVVQTPDGQCTVLDCGPRALRVLPGLEGSLQGQEAPSWTQTYTDPRDGSFSVIQGQDTNGDGVADRMSTTHYSPNGTKERESWDSVDDRRRIERMDFNRSSDDGRRLPRDGARRSSFGYTTSAVDR
jgi:hypothetical protein